MHGEHNRFDDDHACTSLSQNPYSQRQILSLTDT